MPDNGIKLISGSVTVQIKCKGQSGQDFAHQIYLNNNHEQSLIDRSTGLDMTACAERCAEAGFVTVLNAVPLEDLQLSGSLLQISVWTDIQHPDEAESSPPCSIQKALIVRFLVSSAFTYQTADSQLSTILAVIWIPLALGLLWFHSHYYKKWIKHEVDTMRERVGAEQDVFLHNMNQGEPFESLRRT